MTKHIEIDAEQYRLQCEEIDELRRRVKELAARDAKPSQSWGPMPDADLIAEGRELAAELEPGSWYAHIAATMAERLALTARDDQPITPEWLDACGVASWRIWIYYVTTDVKVRFDRSGRLLDVRVDDVCWPITTRQDLRDLLRLIGSEALKEAKE